MKHVLLTGMSGTGTSTVNAVLAVHGYQAVDLDAEEWARQFVQKPAAASILD